MGGNQQTVAAVASKNELSKRLIFDVQCFVASGHERLARSHYTTIVEVKNI